jgi:hypothetical protein
MLHLQTKTAVGLAALVASTLASRRDRAGERRRRGRALPR